MMRLQKVIFAFADVSGQ